MKLSFVFAVVFVAVGASLALPTDVSAKEVEVLSETSSRLPACCGNVFNNIGYYDYGDKFSVKSKLSRCDASAPGSKNCKVDCILQPTSQSCIVCCAIKNTLKIYENNGRENGFFSCKQRCKRQFACRSDTDGPPSTRPVCGGMSCNHITRKDTGPVGHQCVYNSKGGFCECVLPGSILSLT
eukprot:CAMPEP_0184747560 /NCGR_PEP_ID=MMETSP0315-20130426/12252_1 /TAXON_ID=101924 /ORGANISM="Rhodosorus marinus, Strain UTEX LB 2760" /LENGTH=181 /DNA_ID=CAMNT_0027220957 /DNA_START=195 /DNA_END=743 /DNA_ORIENTATION=-